VLVLGNQRAQIAVLIVTKSGFEPHQILLSAQPVIDEVNLASPMQSRLVPDLIKFLPADTVIPKTAKGSIRRMAADEHFKTVIEDMYRLYEVGGTAGVTLISHEQTVQILKSIFSVIFPMALSQPEVDLFTLGLDSLTAIRVRNAINSRIRLPSQPSPTLVYDHANLKSLADYLWSASQSIDATSDEKEFAWELVRESKAALMPRKANSEAKLKTILLTGVTGSLGAHLLASLQSRTDVEKVLVPIRATSPSMAAKRLEQTLSARHLPITFRFEVIPLQESDPAGYDPNEHLYSSVTHTIHAAWPVNFNYALQSYQSHIRHTVHLLNHTSGPFVYISSISTFAQSQHVPESVAETPDEASDMGYARSKWVVEKLMENAGGGIVVRVGQLTGDTVHGFWNEAEVFPAIVRSTPVLQSLPDSYPTGQQVSWLPVDIAASLINRILVQGKNNLYNLVNPKYTPYKMILDRLAQKENLGKLDILPYRAWVEAIRKANSEKVPTTQLLRFLDQAAGAETPSTVYSLSGLQELLGSEFETTFNPMRPDYINLLVASWRERNLLANAYCP
jgi:thioester reductase-like protein